MNPSLEIPIDPALLLEEEHHATDNDLEDAEGELVDQPMEDDYAQEEFDVIHAEPPVLDYYDPTVLAYPASASASMSASGSTSMPRAARSASRSTYLDVEGGSFMGAGVGGGYGPGHANGGGTSSPAVKKRGRPPKHRPSPSSLEPGSPYTANGHGGLYPGLGKGFGSGKGKGGGPGRPRKQKADTNCSFCLQTAERNKAGEPERMVSCHLCGRSGHPSCLNMKTARLRRMVFTYEWTCNECKVCEICSAKGDDARILFCDGCDRGWHSYCLDPPLKGIPKSSWRCPKCRSASSHPPPSSASSSSLAVHPAPPRHPHTSSSTPQPSSSSKIRLHAPSYATPDGQSAFPPMKKKIGRPRKHPLPEETFADTPRIKIKTSAGTSAARKRKRSSLAFGDDDDDDTFGLDDEEIIPAPRPRIKLRITSARKTVELESEEEKVPYGGVITGRDADTTRTTITERDKENFEKARQAGEAKLGAAAVSVSGSGAGSAAGAFGSAGASTVAQALSPAPSVVNGHALHGTPSKTPLNPYRPLRDRVLQNTINGGTPGPYDSAFGASTPGTPGTPGIPPAARATGAGAQKIKKIRFGVYDIDTWYSAPYPEEYQCVPDGRLWLCEFCLKYMKSGFVASRHRIKCKARHPPGDEVYRKDNVSVFEVDGRKNKIYCQNLCLLAKMFLDHKTLYYDVEPFLFYVMTEVDEMGARFVGYFSKEKRSPDNNVSCIMTLPVRQRKGWGQLLIDFSYLLSKKEGRVGGPERPLSGLGEVTYKRYWSITLFRYLRNAPDNPTIEDIAQATSMTPEDVYVTLKDQDFIRELHVPPPLQHTPSFTRKARGRGRPRLTASRRTPREKAQPESEDDEAGKEKITIPEQYIITWDRAYVEAVLTKHDSKGYLELAPERLKYHPFLVTRDPAKPPGVIARATLMANNPQAVAARSNHDPSSNSNGTNGPATKGGKGNAFSANGTHGQAVDDLESVNGTPAPGTTSVPVQEQVLHGEDQATLDLVKALAAEEESPARSLRTRTDSEALTSAPNSISKPRSGRRHRVGTTSEVRTGLRERRRADTTATPRASRRSMRATKSLGGVGYGEMEADGEESDNSDDPLLMYTPSSKVAGEVGNGSSAQNGHRQEQEEQGKGGEGARRQHELLSAVLRGDEDADADAEGEDEDAEGEEEEEEVEDVEMKDDDDDADGEWVGEDEDAEGEEEDAEGEDDDEYIG